MQERVGIFGGSFNPPHVAHVLAAAYVLACTDLQRVVVVPCFRHPFGKPLVEFDDRLAMCRLAFGDYSHVEVSDVERRLGGESVTARTLDHLQAENPEWSMRLIVGGDAAQELDRWTRPERVRELAPPLVLGRVGVPLLGESASAPCVLPDVSSTQVRSALAQRSPTVNQWVPRQVAVYIRSRALYGQFDG